MAIDRRSRVTGEVTADQVTPSVERRIVPVLPTAKKALPSWATAVRSSATPVVTAVHVAPSFETAAAPPTPTATHLPAPWATPKRSADDTAVRRVQLRPSGDVRMAPSRPTATNWPLPQTTAQRLGSGLSKVDETTVSQTKPSAENEITPEVSVGPPDNATNASAPSQARAML